MATDAADALVIWCLYTLLAFAVFGVYVLIFVSDPPELTVTSASVTAFNLSGFPPRLSANFNVTMSVHNPSKLTTHYYHHIVATMLYGRSAIAATTSTPPFHQHTRSSTTLQATPTAMDVVLEPDIAHGIALAVAKDRAIMLDFNVSARVSHRPWGTGPSTWSVHCNGITIWFFNGTDTAGSSMFPAPKVCEVDPW